MTPTEEQKEDFLFDARAGDLELVTEFLNEFPQSSLIVEIKDEYNGSNALHMASANGHIGMVNYLLETLKIDENLLKKALSATNEAGNTPLHWAIVNNKEDVVKILVEAGADPFIKNLAGHDSFYEAEINERDDIVNYLYSKFSVEPDQAEEEEEEGGSEDIVISSN